MKLKISLWIFSIIIIAWLVLPTLVIVPISFNAAPSLDFPPKGWSLQWYEKFFTDPTWLRALGNTLQIALLTTVVATTLGILAALGLAKLRFKGKALLENYFLMPMIVPGSSERPLAT